MEDHTGHFSRPGLDLVHITITHNSLVRLSHLTYYISKEAGKCSLAGDYFLTILPYGKAKESWSNSTPLCHYK